MNHPSRRGFSLIELAIVLTVIGLIIGGVLASQGLMRNSELRKVMTERSRISAAIGEFKNKYGGFPGDMMDATKYWGAADADFTTCQTTQGTGTQTCDGNGDGKIAGAVAGSPYTYPVYENFRAWQQLALAGIWDGQFTGIAGGGGAYEALIETNTPKSPIDGVGYTVQYAGCMGTLQCAQWGDQVLGLGAGDTLAGHVMIIGTQMTADLPRGAFLTAEEAWGIDAKYDDGKPGYGMIRAHNNSTQSTCTTTDSVTTAAYSLSNILGDSVSDCSLFIGLDF